MKEHRQSSVEVLTCTLMQQVKDHVGKHPAQDDITLLVAQCGGA